MPRTDFRARFESKGRFSRYLSSIPTGVIVSGPTQRSLG